VDVTQNSKITIKNVTCIKLQKKFLKTPKNPTIWKSAMFVSEQFCSPADDVI